MYNIHNKSTSRYHFDSCFRCHRCRRFVCNFNWRLFGCGACKTKANKKNSSYAIERHKMNIHLRTFLHMAFFFPAPLWCRSQCYILWCCRHCCSYHCCWLCDDILEHAMNTQICVRLLLISRYEFKHSRFVRSISHIHSVFPIRSVFLIRSGFPIRSFYPWLSFFSTEFPIQNNWNGRMSMMQPQLMPSCIIITQILRIWLRLRMTH